MKKYCDCSPVFPPELRSLGQLDPPNPSYFCNVCKKQWHLYRLTEEYVKKIKNIARTYRYSQKPTFDYKLTSAEDFKRTLELLEIKKINVSAKGEYSCSF